MTGAGLLGLAVGHGVTADLKGADGPAGGEDPQVEQGMKALAGFTRKMKSVGQINGQMAGTYFLWSVERMGMLYGRRTIDDREWYPWGADLLLPVQQGNGSWNSPGYFGATPITDTCFAPPLSEAGQPCQGPHEQGRVPHAGEEAVSRAARTDC